LPANLSLAGSRPVYLYCGIGGENHRAGLISVSSSGSRSGAS